MDPKLSSYMAPDLPTPEHHLYILNLQCNFVRCYICLPACLHVLQTRGNNILYSVDTSGTTAAMHTSNTCNSSSRQTSKHQSTIHNFVLAYVIDSITGDSWIVALTTAGQVIDSRTCLAAGFVTHPLLLPHAWSPHAARVMAVAAGED